jgi:hypothetical protein
MRRVYERHSMMRDPDRIEPLRDLVYEAWLTNPDLRLGQLLIHAASLGGWQNGADIFSAEDDILAQGLRRMIASTRMRRSDERPTTES